MSPASPRHRWFAAAFVACWTVAFIVALLLDVPVARWVHDSGTELHVRNSHWAWWVKVPGGFGFTAAIVALLWIGRRIDWRRALFIVAVAAFAGLNFLPKWIVGRTRPYKLPIAIADQPRPMNLHPFGGGVHGLLHEVNLSFPSGHECTAFALAAAVWIVWRPGAWVLLALAAAVGVERVIENAHYVSDVVGAVGFAALGAWLVRLAMLEWATKTERVAAETVAAR